MLAIEWERHPLRYGPVASSRHSESTDCQKRLEMCQAWWNMTEVSGIQRLKQEDCELRAA